MGYDLVRQVIQLVEEFEKSREKFPDQVYHQDMDGFKQWVHDHWKKKPKTKKDADWEGKPMNRTRESVINTQLVHLYRYAKNYSRAAIHDSDFSTQEEFIYLINLKAFGAMKKMDLIKKNIHDKSAGMQIINRLIANGWVKQSDDQKDKRSKVLQITDLGLQTLEAQMDKIRQASNIVTGNLTEEEKLELIQLLTKLEHFHQPIFSKNIQPDKLLDFVSEKYFPSIN